MPNNIVFNNVAEQLKTQIYGTGGAIATDGDGKLSINTVDEVSNVASVDTVDEVTNVSSVDTVDEVTNVSSVDTVDEVSNVSSVDTVDEVSHVTLIDTLTEITNTVNVSVASNFIEDVATIANYDFTTETTALEISTADMDMYSFYVNNAADSGGAVTAKLQISPTDTDADFIDDLSSAFEIDVDSSAVLVPQKFLKYTRLHLAGTTTGTVIAYFNGH